MADGGVFTTTTVLPQLSFKVESLACWRERLFVGGSDGTLYIYDVHDEPDGSSTYRLTESKRKFHKKSITKITVLSKRNWGILLSSSDNGVAFVTLLNLQEEPTIVPNSKRCGTYVVNEGSGILCINQKKKISTFRWNAGVFLPSQEIFFQHMPKTMTWVGSLLCVGYRKQYALVDPVTGNTVQQMTETGRQQRPSAVMVTPATAVAARSQPTATPPTVAATVATPTSATATWFGGGGGGGGRAQSSNPHGTGSSNDAAVPLSSPRLSTHHPNEAKQQATSLLPFASATPAVAAASSDPYSAKGTVATSGLLLLARDSSGLFYTPEGLSQKENAVALEWMDCPTTLTFISPYVVALTPKHVEVHNAISLRRCQVIELQGIHTASHTLLPIPAAAIATTTTTAPSKPPSLPLRWSGSSAVLFLASSSSVTRLDMAPPRLQAAALMAGGNVRGALTLCREAHAAAIDACRHQRRRAERIRAERSPVAPVSTLAAADAAVARSEDMLSLLRRELSDLRVMFALSQFSKLRYESALCEFISSAVHPSVVLSLFTDLLPLGPPLPRYHSPFAQFAAQYSHNIGPSHATAAANPTPAAPPTSVEIPLLDAAAADVSALRLLLVPYLQHCRSSLPPSTLDADMPTVDTQPPAPTSPPPLSVRVVVDTVLLKAMLISGRLQHRVAIRSFLRAAPACLLGESEAMLAHVAERWRELLWVYRAAGEHARALEWLVTTARRTAASEARSAKHRGGSAGSGGGGDGGVGGGGATHQQCVSATVGYLRSLITPPSHTVAADAAAAAAATEVSPTLGSDGSGGDSGGTEQLGWGCDPSAPWRWEPLVVEGSRWLLRERPTLGLRVFTRGHPLPSTTAVYVLHPSLTRCHAASFLPSVSAAAEAAAQRVATSSARGAQLAATAAIATAAGLFDTFWSVCERQRQRARSQGAHNTRQAAAAAAVAAAAARASSSENASNGAGSVSSGGELGSCAEYGDEGEWLFQADPWDFPAHSHSHGSGGMPPLPPAEGEHMMNIVAHLESLDEQADAASAAVTALTGTGSMQPPANVIAAASAGGVYKAETAAANDNSSGEGTSGLHSGLALRYLEWLVLGCAVKEPSLHTRLVHHYMDAVVAADPTLGTPGAGCAPQPQPQPQDGTATVIVAAAALPQRVHAMVGCVGTRRRKLLSFLLWSHFYDPAQLLPRFNASRLHEEFAVVLSRAGMFHDAIRVYALRLQDHALAKQYCDCIFETSSAHAAPVATAVHSSPSPASSPWLTSPLAPCTNESAAAIAAAAAVGAAAGSGGGHNCAPESDNATVAAAMTTAASLSVLVPPPVRQLVASSRDEAAATVYLALLRAYLSPLPSRAAAITANPPSPPTVPAAATAGDGGASVAVSERVQQALLLVETEASSGRIDVAEALPLFPSHTPLAALLPCLQSVLVSQHHSHRRQQVLKSLFAATHRHVTREYFALQHTSFVVTDSRRCDRCLLFLRSSAVAHTANGRVVHCYCNLTTPAAPAAAAASSPAPPVPSTASAATSSAVVAAAEARAVSAATASSAYPEARLWRGGGTTGEVTVGGLPSALPQGRSSSSSKRRPGGGGGSASASASTMPGDSGRGSSSDTPRRRRSVVRLRKL